MNILFTKVLHFWARQHQASLTPEFLVSKVLLWQRAGYLSKDVWNEMYKIVDQELIPLQEEINEKSDIAFEFVQEAKKDHVTDERQKLCESDMITNSNDLFDRITESIYPSKRKLFTLQVLRLEQSAYDQIIAETIGAEDRNNMVVFENDLYFKEI